MKSSWRIFIYTGKKVGSTRRYVRGRERCTQTARPCAAGFCAQTCHKNTIQTAYETFFKDWNWVSSYRSAVSYCRLIRTVHTYGATCKYDRVWTSSSRKPDAGTIIFCCLQDADDGHVCNKNRKQGNVTGSDWHWVVISHSSHAIPNCLQRYPHGKECTDSNVSFKHDASIFRFIETKYDNVNGKCLSSRVSTSSAAPTHSLVSVVTHFPSREHGGNGTSTISL